MKWFQQQLERSGLGHRADELIADGDVAPASVLLVDDNPENLQILMGTLRPLGYRLMAARDGEAALAVAERTRPGLILLDVMMPGMDGFEVCRRLKANPDTVGAAIIFCSALDDTAAKVKALELGAVDFVTKPFQPDEVVARVGAHLAMQRLAQALVSRNRALEIELAIARTEKRDRLRRLAWCLVGTSPALRQLRAAIEIAAASDEPVLLRSAPACGAEAVARAIHAGSARAERPFLTVDVARAGGAAGLVDGSWFRRGGAEPSQLELADGGTLFVEHVDLLPAGQLDELVGYLRAAAATRADGQRPSPDVRVIGVVGATTAATVASGSGGGEPGSLLGRRAPEARIALGRQIIHVPTLAERADDVAALALEILARHRRAVARPLDGFEPESLAHLAAHAWPGNLRELEDVVVRGADATAAGRTTVRIDPALLQGGVRVDRYQLVRKLGAGGGGEVWEARHHLLARPAAVKLILRDQASDAKLVERFRREARATASLASPHTVTLYDFGVSDQGQFYYVMELLDGIDLQRMADLFGPIAPHRIAHFLVDACRSLAEAHARGLVHRDLKPSNLFACRLGLEVDVLKVLDFGLVRTTDEHAAQLTQAGTILGTPDFIAPEAVVDPALVEARTDIYSLCASAYALLAGRGMFAGHSAMAIVMQHVVGAPVELRDIAPEVPVALADLIMSGLAKAPADRPDAVELMAGLRATGLPQRWTEADRHAWWQEHLPPGRPIDELEAGDPHRRRTAIAPAAASGPPADGGADRPR